MFLVLWMTLYYHLEKSGGHAITPHLRFLQMPSTTCHCSLPMPYLAVHHYSWSSDCPAPVTRLPKPSRIIPLAIAFSQASNSEQFALLLRKWYRVYWRSTSYNLTRTVICIVIASILGSIYFNITPTDEQSTFSYVRPHCPMPCCPHATCNPAFTAQRVVWGTLSHRCTGFRDRGWHIYVYAEAHLCRSLGVSGATYHFNTPISSNPSKLFAHAPYLQMVMVHVLQKGSQSRPPSSSIRTAYDTHHGDTYNHCPSPSIAYSSAHNHRHTYGHLHPRISYHHRNLHHIPHSPPSHPTLPAPHTPASLPTDTK